MRKIPTYFERDWSGDRSLVTRAVNPTCQWVADGEGGACCMIRDGRLFKRRELKAGDAAPDGFKAVGVDVETRKTVGWVPVGAGPEDQWFRESM